MKKKVIISVGIASFLGIFMYSALSNVQPKEIENAPDWLPISVAQKVAAEENKLILVDVFEQGCKFCRAMEREVYPDSTVRMVLDAGYVPVKIDGNSQETIEYNGRQVAQLEFAQKFGVFVFPTTLILDTEGNLIQKRTGYMNVDEFRQFLYNKEGLTLSN